MAANGAAMAFYINMRMDHLDLAKGSAAAIAYSAMIFVTLLGASLAYLSLVTSKPKRATQFEVIGCFLFSATIVTATLVMALN